MNKKKLTIIVCSVLAVLVVGLLVNHFFNWPINTGDASGDISKASRFSREMESEKLTNMEELLKNDTTYKDGIVIAQMVMQTRAAQFGSLVDMSNEVAGEIPAFAEVLKEMNATREMVNNVINSLIESGQNLDAALSGKECSNLEQTTINASLAYTTLQKQNKLADSFIDTTDKYLKTAKGDDHLKFVRDQWVDYQKMTAALDGDKAAAEALAKKGNLLSAEKTLAAMADFGVANKMAIVSAAYLQDQFNVDSKVCNALPDGAMENLVSAIQKGAETVSKKIQNGDVVNEVDIDQLFSNPIHETLIAGFTTIQDLKNAGNAASKNLQNSGNAASKNLQNAGNAVSKNLQNAGNAVSKNLQNAGNASEKVLNMNKGGGPVVFGNNITQITTMIASTGKVMENLEGVMNERITRGRNPLGSSNTSMEQLSNSNNNQSQKLGGKTTMDNLLGNQIGRIIKSTAAGEKVTLGDKGKIIVP